MTQEQLAKNEDVVLKLIEKYVTSDRKDKLISMLNTIGKQYFTAPASRRKSHHSAFTGGLTEHAIKMTKNMFVIAEALDKNISKESLLIVGLFHDLGKATTADGLDVFVYNESDWHRDKLGEMYKLNDKIRDGLTHAQRSIRLLLHYGINVTDDEFQAILFHDGQYVEENKSVKNKESKLLLITHYSDMWTSHIEEV